MFFPLLSPNAKRQAQSRFLQAGNRVIAGLLFLALPIFLSGCGLPPLPVGKETGQCRVCALKPPERGEDGEWCREE